MIRKAILVILPIILLFSLNVKASFYNNTGLTAKVISLGYAFTSLADDPTALYWNPAKLGEKTGAYVSRINPLQIPGYTVDSIVLSRRTNSIMTMGLAYNSERADLLSWDNNIKYLEKRLGAGVSVSVSQIDFGLTGWHSVVTQDGESLQDNCVDAAISYNFGSVSLNMVIHNIASKAAALVPIVGLGVSGNNFRVGLDAVLDEGFKNNQDYYLGLEVSLLKNIKLRLGKNFQAEQISLGLGTRQHNFEFDFAYNNSNIASCFSGSMGINF